MNFTQYVVLFLSVFAGGAVALQLNIESKKVLRVVLAFSGAYLLGITSIHLLPEAFNHSANNHVGYWILGGFLLQLFLEMLSRGVEHGHIHPQKSVSKSFVLPIMLGLFVHAFIEGMPLGAGNFADHHHVVNTKNSLFYGIILHKLPAAFALATLLRLSHFKPGTILFWMLIFASASPCGAFVGELLHLNHSNFQYLLGLVIGTFLHISTTILFEAEEKAHHHFAIDKLIAIAGGLILAVFTG